MMITVRVLDGVVVLIDGSVGPAWTVGVHDPAAAWFIVLAYGVAIACCLRAWRRDLARAAQLRATGPDRRATYAPRFWLLVASLLVVLAINKQLDLQTLITDYGRQVARRGGWYEDRRRVQLTFTLAVGGVSFLALVAIAWRVRAALRRYALSLAGLWLMAVFVGLRVASFHHVDVWFGQRMRGVKFHWIVELLAITVIAAGAVMNSTEEIPPCAS